MCEYCHLAQIGQEATFHIDPVMPSDASNYYYGTFEANPNNAVAVARPNHGSLSVASFSVCFGILPPCIPSTSPARRL